MQDPFVLLERLAKDGLESVSVQVKFDGKIVSVSDASLEIALSGNMPEGDLPQEAKDAIACSLFLVELDAEGEWDIRERAAAGEETAQRAYQAIVLRELVKLRTLARKLVAKFKRGDPRAKAGVASIFRTALTPGPGQGRARTCVYLLRDAKRELEAKEAKAPPATPKPASAAPEPAAPPSAPSEGAAPAPIRDVSAAPVQQHNGVR